MPQTDEGAPSPPMSRDAQATATVTLDVGHCWVEPVEFDGDRWGIPLRRQFGWGGGLPGNWQGSGEMARMSESRARYVDKGGAVIYFLPADAPAVAAVETELCD